MKTQDAIEHREPAVPVPRLVRWFCGFFKKHQWARKRIGGKWELWWVDPCCEYVWIQCDEFWNGTEATRPGACWPNSRIFTSTEDRPFPRREFYTANGKDDAHE